MNRNDLFRAMEYIDEKTIENSEVNRTVKYQKKSTKRTFLLAAMLSLFFAFATVAVAARLFGIKDTLVDSNDPEIKSEMVLSGFTDSNEYKAAAEWLAFAESYDPDGSILAQVDPEGPDDISLDEKYMHYPVYTQEMADKIEEIAAKYGLTLYGSVLPGDLNLLVAKLIVNDNTEFSDEAYNTMTDGYMFEDGTFSFDGIFDASFGRLSVDYQFRRSVKGVFDPVFLNIGDIEDYQEQPLTTDSGVQLVAAISEYKSVLITEFDSCFVSINVMGGTDIGITFDDLKDLANTFDFSVIESRVGKSAPDSQELPSAKSEREQSYIEFSREGVVDKIPVETVSLVNSCATIAMAPEYFSHNIYEGIDTFTYDAWAGERKVYYSVYPIAQSSPNQICEELMKSHADNYASSNVFAVKVGSYDATTVQFDSETDSPSNQLHFFIIPTDGGCIVIEAQFDFEMYEGLYRIMLALFDTLKIS